MCNLAIFGALNPRINTTRSGGNWLQPVPQVKTSSFSIPSIFWLSNLVSIFYRASGLLCTAVLWTAIYMSPLTHMQVYFESWTKLKLRLKVENFIKEYV
jgi:hypothetical protein